MPVPRLAHFVFGLLEQTEPFHPMHYLALESCRQVLQPDAILFHHHHLPYGAYWDRIRPHLELHEVDLVPEVLAAPHDEQLVPAQYRYAHHADFLRLDALLEHGGVYADMDTLFVHPFPDDLFEAPFVVGREPPQRDQRTGEVRPSTCNALLMAEPGSKFARAWRDRMADAMDGSWSNHCGFLPQQLSEDMPDHVRVEPPRSFFRYGSDPRGIALLFERLDTDWDGVLSLHLWSHLWWEQDRQDFSGFHHELLDEAYLRAGATTYAALARRFLPDLDPW